MKCPGQDSRYWKPGAIFEAKCPKCGNRVEFFKDDTARKCEKCGHRFVNPNMDFGCASYCEYAEQCLGTLPEEVLAQKQDLLKDRVAVEMKRYYKSNFAQIGHAGRVARHAERIGKKEGGVIPVILCAAYLYGIGDVDTRPNNGGQGSGVQENEGEKSARLILEKLKANPALVDEVCDIISRRHNAGPNPSLNFKVVFDSNRIAELEELQRKNPMNPETLEETIDTSFLTDAGREEAKAVLIQK
jgi:hypothetical protein